MGENTQSMRPVRCRSSRLANHHIRSVSGGRGHRAPRRVLDTHPLYWGLRPARAHGTPRNIRSARRQPEAVQSIVFSFEAIPFDLRIVPALAVVQTVADAASLVARGMPAAWKLLGRSGYFDALGME